MPATMTGISMVKSSSLLAKTRSSMFGKMAEQAKPSRLQGSRMLRGAGARNLVHSPVEQGHNDAASVLEFSLELVDFAVSSALAPEENNFGWNLDLNPCSPPLSSA